MAYKSKFQDEFTDKLFEAVLKLNNTEECYRFFEDICTVKEIQSISQRLEVARLLKKGRTYSDIEEATGASTATISRVNRSLHYGADGYKLILERMESQDKDNNKEENQAKHPK